MLWPDPVFKVRESQSPIFGLAIQAFSNDDPVQKKGAQ